MVIFSGMERMEYKQQGVQERYIYFSAVSTRFPVMYLQIPFGFLWFFIHSSSDLESVRTLDEPKTITFDDEGNKISI